MKLLAVCLYSNTHYIVKIFDSDTVVTTVPSQLSFIFFFQYSSNLDKRRREKVDDSEQVTSFHLTMVSNINNREEAVRKISSLRRTSGISKTHKFDAIFRGNQLWNSNFKLNAKTAL